MSRPNVKWILYVLIGVVVLLALAVAGVSLSTRSFRNSDLIAQNVTVAGLPCGRLRTAEAQRQLEQEWLPTLPETVSVKVADQTRDLPAKELGREPQIARAVAKAWRLGREGNMFSQFVTRMRLVKAPVDVPVEITVDPAPLSASLVELAQEVDREPVDATVSVSGDDDVDITPGKVGIALDRKAAADVLTAALKSGKSEAVELPCKETQPRVTAKDLSHLEVVLGSYATPYSAGKVDRTHNLKLAIDAVNKTVVMPGEVFSTDQTIGPRIAKRGFREAPIFQDGEVTPATGGGICQIATTIYNAALFAGLQMVERHHHSQPVTYAPAGRDATVYAGQLDMRFRNSTGYPILILGSLTGSHVQVRILGKKEANKKVRLERTGVTTMDYTSKEIPDPNLDLGKREVEKPGRKGIKVTVYRIIKEADGTETRQELHTDVYRAQNEVVRVGTKPIFHKGPDGKPILGPDGKPVPVKLGPDGKPLPYKPPAAGKPAAGAKPPGKPGATSPKPPKPAKPANGARP